MKKEKPQKISSVIVLDQDTSDLFNFIWNYIESQPDFEQGMNSIKKRLLWDNTGLLLAQIRHANGWCKDPNCPENEE